MVVKQIPLRIRKYANSPGPSAFTPADIILGSLDWKYFPIIYRTLVGRCNLKQDQ